MLIRIIMIAALVAVCETAYAIALEIEKTGRLTILSHLHLFSTSLVLGVLFWSYSKKKTMKKLLEKVNCLQAENEKTSAYFGLLFESMPCPVSVVSPEFELLRINQAVSDLTHVKPEDVVGKKCYDVYGNGEVCEGCPVKKVLETKTVQKNVKEDFARKNNVYIQQTAVPVLDGCGSVVQVIEFVNDVTEKVKLELENRTLFVDMVTAFAGLIDSRDTSTGIHSKSVKDMSLSIGTALGLTEHALEELVVAALLHDIGKIGIPEQILNKPGRLSVEEFAVIKQHPVIGYNHLVTIKPLKTIAEYVLYHHEKYDGTGYPEGLKGEAIPLAARILAIADVYEAVTADRVYRPAMSKKQAVGILVDGRGTQFDPMLVDLFIELLRDSESDVREVAPEVEKSCLAPWFEGSLAAEGCERSV